MINSRDSNIVLLKKEKRDHQANPPPRVRKQFVLGTISTSEFDKNAYAERVRVGINIKAKANPKPADEWELLLKRKEPIQVGKTANDLRRRTSSF